MNGVTLKSIILMILFKLFVIISNYKKAGVRLCFDDRQL